MAVVLAKRCFYGGRWDRSCLFDRGRCNANEFGGHGGDIIIKWKQVLFDLMQVVVAIIIVVSRIKSFQRSAIEKLLSLHEPFEIMLHLLEFISGREEVLVHDLRRTCLDLFELLGPEPAHWLLVIDNVVRRLRPRMI